MMDVVADISATNKSLSWNPEISLKEGLKQILLKRRSMFLSLKTFLRQELDVLSTVNFFELISFI